jgi:hypothetical protein
VIPTQIIPAAAPGMPSLSANQALRSAVRHPGCDRILCLVDPGGIARRMTDLRHLSPSPELMVHARGIAVNLGAGNIGVDGLVTLTAVMLTLAACWRAPLWRAIPAASAGSFRITAAVLLIPVPMLLALAGSPCAAATPPALLAFLASLAWMSRSGTLESVEEVMA